ncbi:hypothetical protein [Streptomyces sp. NPDC005407]|uniref:hypothetical protein n=1 Tax=Streptomyces sp. NPDC005407 TaxID=3155340 RepID=UPI0033BDE758
MTPAPKRTGPLAGLDLAPFGFTGRCWVNAPEFWSQLLTRPALTRVGPTLTPDR